jgi:hypothetical protein
LLDSPDGEVDANAEEAWRDEIYRRLDYTPCTRSKLHLFDNTSLTPATARRKQCPHQHLER